MSSELGYSVIFHAITGLFLVITTVYLVGAARLRAHQRNAVRISSTVMEGDKMLNRVKLEILRDDDREQFIKDNQEAFNYGALEEFGLRDNHFEEDGEIISRDTIEKSIDLGTAYRIYFDGKSVGGAVVKVKGNVGDLDLLFINPGEHTKGIGQIAWRIIEEMYPQVRKWETFTPYFETRNIHFYVNKCGFHIVEFFNMHHPLPPRYRVDEGENMEGSDQFDGMFRFEKIINA